MSSDDQHDQDEDTLFAAAMQDVEPLSKGRPQQLKTAREVTEAHLARRDAALGINDNSVDPNFLTLGEVPARQPLEYLEWKKDGVQRAVFGRSAACDAAATTSKPVWIYTAKPSKKRAIWCLTFSKRPAPKASVIC